MEPRAARSRCLSLRRCHTALHEGLVPRSGHPPLTSLGTETAPQQQLTRAEKLQLPPNYSNCLGLRFTNDPAASVTDNNRKRAEVLIACFTVTNVRSPAGDKAITCRLPTRAGGGALLRARVPGAPREPAGGLRFGSLGRPPSGVSSVGGRNV